VLTRAQYFVLSARMRALMTPDPHMPSVDGYLISSLYFDDMQESAYYEKISGSADRKKYRMRIYNGDLSRIRLECKHKAADRIEKRSAPLDEAAYYALMRGDMSVLAARDNALCSETYGLCASRVMMPRVVVSYLREAYVHPLSNTRITFDKQLRAGWTSEAMLRQMVDDVPVFPTGEFPYPEAVILEIKYDEFIPKFITDALQTGGTLLAASKYVLCRDALHMIGKRFLPQ
jgi:hypothetical protein